MNYPNCPVVGGREISSTQEAIGHWFDPEATVSGSRQTLDVTVVANSFASDEQLSYESRGMLLRIFVEPNFNNPNREAIKEMLGITEYGIKKFIRETKEAGYLKIIEHRPDLSNPRLRYEYKFFQVPPVQTRYHFWGPREDGQEETPVQTDGRFSTTCNSTIKETPVQTDGRFSTIPPYKQINDTNTSKISQSDKKDDSSIGKPTNQQAQPKSQPEDQTMDKKKSGRERLEEHLSQAMAHEYMFCSMEEAQEATEKIMELFLHTKKRQDPQHQRTLINPKIDELYGYALECMKEFPKTERTPHDAVMSAVSQFHGRMHQENFDFIASCWVDDHMDLLKKTIYESIKSGQVNAWSRWSRR